MEKIRVHKFLSNAGYSSRRKAEDLILQRKIRINGEIVETLGVKVDPENDRVEVAGKLIQIGQRKIYAFNKPKSVVSTLKDTHGRKCIADFVKHLPFRVYPVGRLDFDVTGLLLLTNDGDFGQKLLHPSFETPRVYLALLVGTPDLKDLSRLISGIELEDGRARVSKVEFVRNKKLIEKYFPKHLDQEVVKVQVTEGRKHFVKRIFKAIGFPVRALVRISFGPYNLGNLQSGELREVAFLDF